ncbi:MAG: HalD/BesD family halogenase [Dongiaceae bacterium]
MTMTMATNSETALPVAPDPRRLVDLARYPIDRLEDAAGAALLADGRARITQKGVMALPGFLMQAAVAAMRDEALALAPKAHPGEKRHNVYLIDRDPRYRDEHPRNRVQSTQVSTVADDLIPRDSRLRALYDWPPLRSFLAAVLEKPALHPYADPLASLNVTIGRPGEQLGWHFDNADFATTLMLQDAESGGQFEYCPGVRAPADQGYAAVERILAGTYDDVRRLPMAPGTLVLFRGRYALHRVTPIDGHRPRLMAVLSYDTEPGITLSEPTRMTFYGRVR